MTRITDTSFTRRHPLLWGLFLGLALGANVVSAATPRASFGSALITSADNRISVTRVPVINSAGAVSYKDVTINFTVDTAGTLTLATGTPTINTSPSLNTGAFSPGNYKDTRGNTYKLNGPSVIPGTNRSLWSLVFVSGSDATMFSMTWITGPVMGHPYEPSLKARSITSNSYTWGLVGKSIGASPTYFPFYSWDQTAVVGTLQAGNQIVFYLFENADNGIDASTTLTKY